MAIRITEDQKIRMNILYQELKTYAAVAREIGCSPTTVKRYIIPDFVNPNDIEKSIIQVNELPPIDMGLFKSKSFGELCLLSDAEKNAVKELWKELII